MTEDFEYDFYLSYSVADRVAAGRLTGLLRRARLTTFRPDEAVSAGVDFWDAVKDAISRCRALVVLWSTDALSSAAVRNEAELGAADGKLVHVAIGDVSPRDLPPGFLAYPFLRLEEVERDPEMVRRLIVDLSERRKTEALSPRRYDRALAEDAPTDDAAAQARRVSDLADAQTDADDAAPSVASASRPAVSRAKSIGRALAWPIRRAARLAIPPGLARWAGRGAGALAVVAAAFGLLTLAEPYFEPAPERAVVADLAFVDGVERIALIDGRAQVRVVEGETTLAVLRGHGASVSDVVFVDGGAAIETRDAAGDIRRTRIDAVRALSFPEADDLALGGWGASAWAAAGAPLLSAAREGWRAAECASGLGRWCPLTVFRDTLVDGSLAPEMVVIPAGSFLMGSPGDEEGREEDEGPQRLVFVPRFALAATEVTVADYRRFVEATGYKTDTDCFAPADGDGWSNPGFEQSDQDPVVCVSWADAQAYTVWLNRQTLGAPYRLPSEAEWEYAARAGSPARFYFGDDGALLAEHAWFTANSNGRTRPVAGKLPNAFGLYDMYGNALEWTADCWHSSYANGPREASAWLDAGNGICTLAALRGGSWNYGDWNLRSAARSWFRRSNRLNLVGFRLARTLPGD